MVYGLLTHGFCKWFRVSSSPIKGESLSFVWHWIWRIKNFLLLKHGGVTLLLWGENLFMLNNGKTIVIF
jgi:hypothetical protein